MEKKHLELRLAQMTAEGTRFRAGVNIGVDIPWDQLRERYDALVVATGALVPPDLPLPGRDLPGVHFAMEYLVQSNKRVAGDAVPDQITAEGKHVIVLGGGDTGADCIGTAHRQGALSVTNFAIGVAPSVERPASQPWPMHPTLFEVQSAHEEGGQRHFLASTVEVLASPAGEGRGGWGLRRLSLSTDAGCRKPVPSGRSPRILCCSRWGLPARRPPRWGRNCGWWHPIAATLLEMLTMPLLSRVFLSPEMPVVVSRSSCGQLRRAVPPPPPWIVTLRATRCYRVPFGQPPTRYHSSR